MDIHTLTEAGRYQLALAGVGGATVGGDTTLGMGVILITVMGAITTIITIIMVAVMDIIETELAAKMPVGMYMVREEEADQAELHQHRLLPQDHP